MCGALKIISVSICHPIKPTAVPLPEYMAQPSYYSSAADGHNRSLYSVETFINDE